MTDEQMILLKSLQESDTKQLVESLRELKEEVRKLAAILGGVPLDGKPGLLIEHLKLLVDIYGKENGVLTRISGLEDDKKKVIWIAIGAGIGAGASGGALFKLLTHL